MSPYYGMRDNSLGSAPPTHIEPDMYSHDRLVKARAQRDAILAMSEEELLAKMQNEFQEANESYDQYEKQNKENLVRYETMKSMVDAWSPPSREHDSLKRFMLEQLDTGKPYIYHRARAKEESVRDYQAKLIADYSKTILDCEREYAKELVWVAEANKWIARLIEDVPMPAC